MAEYSFWAQQQRPATNDYSNMGRNWGKLGSGTFGVPDTNFNNRPNFGGDYSNMMDWGNAGKSMLNPTSLTAGNLKNIEGFDLSNLNIGGQQIAKGGMFDNMLGPNGWGGLALGAAGGLASTIMGMKQYGLAKKTLAENKRQFQLNYDAQKQTTNTRLEDRQAARVAANPTAYQSVGDYMNKNRIV